LTWSAEKTVTAARKLWCENEKLVRQVVLFVVVFETPTNVIQYRRNSARSSWRGNDAGGSFATGDLIGAAGSPGGRRCSGYRTDNVRCRFRPPNGASAIASAMIASLAILLRRVGVQLSYE
jgi:hypothetical protein